MWRLGEHWTWPLRRASPAGLLLSDTQIRSEPIPTVCIDCRYIGTRPSGIGEVVRGLIDHAPALAPDLDFLLLRNPSLSTPLSEAGNVTEAVVRAGPNSPQTMWMLPEIAPLGGIDLFHGTYNTMPARMRVPVVTTVHDVMWLSDPGLCDASTLGWVKRQFYSHGLRRALARSTHIATVSAATRDAILALEPGLSDRVSVTLSGVSDRFTRLARDDAMLERIGLPAGASYVLLVGQHAPYKNHERALEGFAQAFGGDSAVRLVFVQRQGRSTRSLETRASMLGIADRVHFSGPVTEDELMQLYSSASVLLHPSLCEGFGIPVAEAMACGCPVITSNVSAMPEVAGGAARLIDPRNSADIARALRDVCGTAEVSEAMRQAGVARARELRWEDFARANVDIYRAILSAA